MLQFAQTKYYFFKQIKYYLVWLLRDIKRFYIFYSNNSLNLNKIDHIIKLI